ncbi:MAG: R3H domain-containing nucleic acid-binding protein [bacterium]|nr:R3H domain-containing nucleic acid-binding protein [bacterium]
MDSLEQKIKDIASEFVGNLGIQADLEVEKQSDRVVVKILGENLGILIGFHGETLESLQLLLSLVVNKKLAPEEWLHVDLDVGGWKGEREEALRSLVEQATTKVKETGQPASLPPMPASQRRFVHLLFSEDSDLEAVSQDEGAERHIVITTKN